MFESPRASKRRKTVHEDNTEVDVEVDTPRQTRSARKSLGATPVSRKKEVNGKTHDHDQPALSTEAPDELGDQPIITKSCQKRQPVVTPRRTPRAQKQDEHIKQEDTVQEEASLSISKSNARSSGRQRRAPRRYSPEVRKSTPRVSVARGTPVPEHVVEEAVKSPVSTTRRRLRFEVADEKLRAASRSPTRSSQAHRWKSTLLIEETPEVEEAEDGLCMADPVLEVDEIELDIQEDQDNDPMEVNYLPELDTTIAIELPHATLDNNSLPDHEEDSPDIAFLKNIALGKLTGRRQMQLVDLADEHKKVHHLLEQTVVAGEGNSMLLIGARGTGKTTLVNSIVRDLSRSHEGQFHVIRLNGFVHTDDKLALREIWRQLGREMDIEEEETGQVKNYADTLATLLALLSHSTEQGPQADGSVGLETEIAKSVIFIMDEFDLFTTHPRQTLLYNLFDIAQARKAPIAVLGLTTRVDAAEMLEKRVKSRFSHRYVHLSFAKSLAAFLSICKASLRIEYEELDFDERAKLAKLSNTTATPTRHKSPASAKKTNYMDSLSAWNTAIEAMLGAPATIACLTNIYRTTKSIPSAFSSFLLPISSLHIPSPSRASTAAQPPPAQPYPLAGPDSHLTYLHTLPTLPLILLIAAARLSIILDTPLTNFNMAYAEYLSIAQRARIAGNAATSGAGLGGRVWGREVAREGWDVLVERELLVPTGTGGGAGGGGGGYGAKGSDMWRVDVALEEIEGAVMSEGGEGVEEGLLRWCREI